MQLVGWSVALGLAMAYAQQVLLTFKLRKHTALLALLPLLPLFLYLPWLPSSCQIRTVLSISLLLIAPSKLALLAFDAPLDPLPWLSSGFPQFCVSTLLPIRIASSPQPSSSPDSFFLKLIVLIAILNLYPVFPSMPIPLLYFLYCIHFYLGIELAICTVARIVERLFSVPLCSQFDRPYLADSLSNFWARRWNITVHSLLKAMVYKPVLLALGPGKGMKGKTEVWVAHAAATVATFAVSGVIHEVIFMYVSKGRATGEMTTFFVVQGAGAIAERAMSRHVPAMPHLLRQILTVAFVCVSAAFFFMNPLHREGIDWEAIAEYHGLQSVVLSLTRVR